MESGLLNNRELASLFWLGGIAAWLLVRHRRSTVAVADKLLRALRPVLPQFLLYVIWMALVVGAGRWLGLWDLDLLKSTVLWTVLSGVGLLAGTTEALRQRGWFRRVVISTLGATAVLEFFVNLKSFPLVLEIVLQPLIFFALVLPVVARNPEHQPVWTIAGWTSALLGFAAFGWTALGVVRERSDLDLGQLLDEAVLPVWLTVGALGFLYPLTLYMAYEQLLKRMRCRAKGSTISRQRLAVIAYGGPRLSVARDLQGGSDYDVVHADGFVAALRAIRLVRVEQRRQREAERAATQRLIDNAGVDGWNENRRRLDEREFDETRKALRWLATCHMGHYRNHDRYRADLLPIVESHFVRDGLPKEHGVVMIVAEDGQLWYAHRRTVSGWYFAIGATAPPPDQWHFDGPEPPVGFPDEASWSRFGGGEFATQW
jgi:hypothetical protein